METFNISRDGLNLVVTVDPDSYHGAPWKENDGHGIVTDWVSRDKRPGELILNEDGRSKRFYDFAATMKIAKRDAWGISDENKKQMAEYLGRPPTKGEITAASVMADYEYLRAWCADEWQYVTVTAELSDNDNISDSIGGIEWGLEPDQDVLDYVLSDYLMPGIREQIKNIKNAIPEDIKNVIQAIDISGVDRAQLINYLKIQG